MLVGDLINNDDFDVNCNYAVYDCTNSAVHWNHLEPVFSTKKDGHTKPLYRILDMKIKYITMDTENNVLIIEATK